MELPMKRVLLTSGLLVLGISGASAADMAVKAPAYTPPPQVLSWNGWYAGVNGGYGWQGSNHKLTNSITSDYPDFGSDGDAITFWGDKNFKSRGGFAGAQLGYNWQRGNFLVGWEADYQWADIRRDQNLDVLAPYNSCGGERCGTDDATASSWANSRLRQFGTFRGRVGYAFGPALIYGTGGLAFGQVRDSLTVVAVDANDESAIERIVPLSTHTITSDTAKLGYVVGGGAEYMFASSWSVKAEYQFMDLGSNTLFATSDNRGDHAEATAQFNHRYHTVRVGLNYHFGP
jgi:outer membrane immunogenic protein